MGERVRRVVIDLGTGDGRWLYRYARAHPDADCIGIDAVQDRWRRVARRTGRRPERGGARNLRFARAAVEELPREFAASADEVYVHFPWGTLFRALLQPDPLLSTRIAGLLKVGGQLNLFVNAAVLDDERVLKRFRIPMRNLPDLRRAMISAYTEAGLRTRRWEIVPVRVRTTWAGRLGQGRALRTLVVEAAKERAGWTPSQATV